MLGETMDQLFFDGWLGLLRSLVVGALAYVALVLLLRVSGKRTLSKMNAFDLVVTVALGSTLATVLLSKDVALAEGALAFLVLIALQFAVSWSSVRSRGIRRLIRSDPTLLLRQGRMLDEALRKQRVTQAEVRAAVRAAGVASLEEVEAVVLESDGSFSVVRRGDGSAPASSLDDVNGTGAR
jgi:uncharacterized membrane protein YcaP (DUF421 family)